MSNPIEKWLDRKRLSSFRDFPRFDDSWDRMLQDFFGNKRGELAASNNFSPSSEISEDATHYLMKFDLPGVQKENIHIEAHNDLLTVSAERKEEKTSTENKRHLSEVFYGTYSRTFQLPQQISEKSIEAKFENGVLAIKVPKTEISQARKIPVQ